MSLLEIYPYALRRGARLVKSPWQTGEDVAHDAIVSLIEAGNADKPVRFMMQDVKFRVSNASRRKMVDAGSETFDEAFGGSTNPAVDVIFLRQVAKVVSTFPPRDQRVFTLVYALDFTVPEAAAEVGVKTNVVEKTLTRIRKALREWFGAEPEAPKADATLRHDDGKMLSGDRKVLAEALETNHRVIGRLITGDMKSYKGWRLIK